MTKTVTKTHKKKKNRFQVLITNSYIYLEEMQFLKDFLLNKLNIL